MSSGSQGLSFHQGMTLSQMCARKEEMFSLPVWKEKLTSLKNTSNKRENRQAKRKLYLSGSTSEDEADKNMVSKKRRNLSVTESSPSPGFHSKPKTPTCAQQRHSTVPLSERQQMALLMRQITDESHHDNDGLLQYGNLNSPLLAANKRTLNIDCKSYKRNSRGETSLHTAAIKGDLKTVKKLVETGIDVNIKDYAGWTALHEACNYGRIDVAKCLLKAGANVNVQGLDNDLPLHDAARNGHLKIVKLLLSYGANPLLQNLKGKSSLDVAKSNEMFKLMSGDMTKQDNCGSDFILSSPKSFLILNSLSDKDESLICQEEFGFDVDNNDAQDVLRGQWDYEIIDAQSCSSRAHSLVTSTSSHLCEHRMPLMSSSTNQNQECNLSLNKTYNSVKVFNLAMERPFLSQNLAQESFDLSKHASRGKDFLTSYFVENDRSGIVSLSCKNPIICHSRKYQTDLEDFNFDISKPLHIDDKSSTCFTKSGNILQTSSSSVQSKENSMSFVSQFEDISDPEDEADAVVKLKNSFLVSNLQKIVHQCISSNPYKPSTKCLNATKSICGTMSQLSLLQNLHLQNFGYGCFPMVASTSTASQLLQTNINLSSTSLCNPVSFLKSYSLDKSPRTTISCSAFQEKSCNLNLREVNNLNARVIKEKIKKSTPESTDIGFGELLSEYSISSIRVSDVSDKSVAVVITSGLNWQSSKRITDISNKEEPFEDVAGSGNLTTDLKNRQRISNDPLITSSHILSDKNTEKCRQYFPDNIGINLNLARNIEIFTFNNYDKLHIPSACPSSADKSILLNNPSISTQSNLSEVLTLAESAISRVSGSMDTFDCSLILPKVPPIKIVLPPKNCEADSEGYVPVIKAAVPNIINDSMPGNITIFECPATSAQRSLVLSGNYVENAPLVATESQNSHFEQDSIPAKKRRLKHGCRTPGKDVEIISENSQRVSRDSNITSFTQNNEDGNCKFPHETMLSTLRNTVERRVTRSTTANKLQHHVLGSQKDHRFQVHLDINTSNVRDDSSNPAIILKSDDHSSCKDEEETVHSMGKKTKIKGQKAVNDICAFGDSTVPIPPPHIFRKPVNPYETHLNFKKKVLDRRNKLSSIYPKPPPKLSEYLLLKGTYRLDATADSGFREPLSMLSAPASISDTMRMLFNEQEQLRSDMRYHHHKERDRLILSAEQETLRIHGKVARTLANEGPALSVCAILCSENPCCPLESDQVENKDSRSRHSGRHFHGLLQEISKKYSRLKMELLARHRHEATILHSMQKLCWEWKLKELGLCDCYSIPSIDSSHVPAIVVEDQLTFNIS